MDCRCVFRGESGTSRAKRPTQRPQFPPTAPPRSGEVLGPWDTELRRSPSGWDDRIGETSWEVRGFASKDLLGIWCPIVLIGTPSQLSILNETTIPARQDSRTAVQTQTGKGGPDAMGLKPPGETEPKKTRISRGSHSAPFATLGATWGSRAP